MAVHAAGELMLRATSVAVVAVTVEVTSLLFEAQSGFHLLFFSFLLFSFSLFPPSPQWKPADAEIEVHPLQKKRY